MVWLELFVVSVAVVADPAMVTASDMFSSVAELERLFLLEQLVGEKLGNYSVKDDSINQ